MILILSDRSDKHADRVEEQLVDAKARYVRFNLDVESLKKCYVHFAHTSWQVHTPTARFETSEISRVWMRRPFIELTLEEQQDTSIDFKLWLQHVQLFAQAVHFLLVDNQSMLSSQELR